MAIELQILGYAALLQFVQFVLMAVPVNMQLGTGYTGGPRDEQKEASGVPGRLKRAMDNHFEGLILFTIAVLVVVVGNVGNGLTENCAWAYLIARIIYVPAYASGIPMLRSAIWSVGSIATLIMIVTALF
jgi:uncharacterized MAPEG superfamily protein